MIVLAAEQGRVAEADGFRAGIDFIAYEQAPLGPGDLVYLGGRWIDRRTTDGEILAVDGRNAVMVLVEDKARALYAFLHERYGEKANG